MQQQPTSAVRRSIAASLLVIFAVSSLTGATSVVRFPAPHHTAYSHDQEIRIGRQAAAEVRRQMQVLPDDHPLTLYVRSLGQRLVPYVPNTSRYPRFPYEFHVVNSKAVNAFALPGGPVFINVGAIRAADNEAQLLGVIAHEMSHVYERHATSQATNRAYTQGLIGFLGAMLGGGPGGNMARGAGSLAAGGLFLHYSRTAESEADHVGALLMYQAGYNPQALADFFRKLEKSSSGRSPQFLSDHPNPGNRAVAIDSLIRQLPKRQFTNGDAARFAQMHQVAMTGSAAPVASRPSR